VNSSAGDNGLEVCKSQEMIETALMESENYRVITRSFQALMQ